MSLNLTTDEWDIGSISRYCQTINGVDLAQGVSSLSAPAHLLSAFDNRPDIEMMHVYSAANGIQKLRYLIANKMRQFNHVFVDPLTQIIITHGATGALACAIKALFNPGDEVFLFEPFYPGHRNLLEFFGIKVKCIPINLEDFSFDLEHLEQSISGNTRGILLCNPANPSGKVFQRDELNALSDIAEKYNFHVISDEIYEYITYDAHQHVSFASLANNSVRTITISGFSKTYNISGWRLGYASGPEPIIQSMAKIQDLLYVCPTVPLQSIAKQALFLPASYYKNMLDFYQKQRKTVINFFIQLGLKPIIPQGAYYALIDISDCFDNDQVASQQLLQTLKIATIPGRIFFESIRGQQYIRVCFAKMLPC